MRRRLAGKSLRLDCRLALLFFLIFSSFSDLRADFSNSRYDYATMNFQTIKFRLLLLGAVLIIATTVLRMVVALPFVQEQLSNLAAAQQLSVASYIARDIDQSIAARRALIGRLAGTLPPSLLQQPQELDAWIDERQRLNPLFNNGLLVIRADGKGTLAGHSPAMEQGKSNFSDDAWFRTALAATTPVISTPQRGAAGAPIIIMATPLHDAQQRIVAVLAGVAKLDAPGFLNGLQKSQLGATGSFLLISPADKLFVGASDRSMIMQPTPLPGVNLLHDRAMAGYRGTGVTINAKGVEELSAMVGVPSTGWFVVARMPTAEAFHTIDVLRGLVWKGSLLALVGVLALMLFVLPRILRPLTDVAHAMREMADGKRELAPLPVTRNDEVGSLVLGFNYLVARLREKEAALTASEARMSFIAHHDSLTGLYNRTMLDDRLQQAMARAERNGSCFALLFCDLDGFKPINDSFGHDVGDAVLVQVAARLAEGRRQIDTVARLGGDEFVILLADLVDAENDAENLARQYLTTIGMPYHVNGVSGATGATFTLTVSIGIALYQPSTMSGSQLISQADIAMYRAKRAGKNRICFFEEGTTAPAAADASMAAARA
jgi:diguanylate cyclase